MRFEHSIDIDATPAQVWAVLAGVERWPQWTPTMKSFAWVEGDALAPGAKARLHLDGAPPGVWTVTRIDDGRSFAWENDTRGVHTVGDHVLEPRGNGSRVTLSLDQTGFMALMFRPMIARVARRNLPIEAESLKRASEAPS